MKEFFLTLIFILLTLSLPVQAVQNIKVSVNHEFTLTLKSNATTAYGWQLAKPINGKLLKFLGSKYYPERTGLVGSGGVERWIFKALKCGKTKLYFKYVRPWEKGGAPVDMRTYLITIR